MPDPKLRFRFREPTVDTNLPISDGTVKVEGTPTFNPWRSRP